MNNINGVETILDYETLSRLRAMASSSIVGGDISKCLVWLNVLEMQVETLRRVLSVTAAKSGISDEDMQKLLDDNQDSIAKEYAKRLN